MTQKIFNRKKNRVIALALAAVLAVSAIGAGIGSTLAAKPNVPVEISKPNTYTEIAKGATRSELGRGLRYQDTSDAAIATATVNAGGTELQVTGNSAGVATISVGSNQGYVVGMNYQIRDDSLIGDCYVKNGGELYLKAPTASNPNVTAASPVVVDKAFNTITWRSLQADVATVNASGVIKAEGKGAAIILGEFTDIWGVRRDIHILVMVGIRSGSLADLLEWIAKGEGILELEDNPYTSGSLADLENAVDGGWDVVDMEDPSEQQVQDAIDAIKDAIDALEKDKQRPENVLGPDSGGNYYKPVDYPPNVYEIVDEDGNSISQPPAYIYNEDGDPIGSEEKNRPAEKGDNEWTYWVEDPEGSNIWKKVDSNGSLDEDSAIWGGGNGKPGGGDDKPAKLFDNDYWVNRGQNVWQKVNPNGNNNKQLGPVTGGGPDRDPSTDGVTQIYEHSDGKFFVGPLGEPGHEYYYGDPIGGDGFLDSTAGQLYGDDVIWYKDSNGNMTTTPPVGGGNPDVADENGNGGRVLSPEQTGDTVDWIEIARSGAYSLILRSSFLNAYNGYNGDAMWQVATFGANTNYIGSTTQTRINNWFKTITTVTGGDNLPSDARLRDYTMQNDATTKLGMGSTVSGMTNAFSLPTPFPAGDGDNVAFALSYTEAANFVSITHDVRGMNPEIQPSAAAAVKNFNKLPSQNQDIWLRTPGDING
ncbi:MAG: hypothetical protein FWH26_06655, partial [Oscillospiraceae bacterium]|nr:hypothetical protein [Oscillospiraceae bacterium]